MSYIKLICPSCQNKHEVSKFYIKENNILSLEELIKQICTCYNIIDTHDYSDENKSDFIDESIFKKKAFIQLNKKTTLKNRKLSFLTSQLKTGDIITNKYIYCLLDHT